MTGEEWILTLKRPALVVGNGVLYRPIPESEYHSVIRINNYQLGGFSGEKVTHWATSGYKDIESRPIPLALIPWSTSFQRRAKRYDYLFGHRVGVEVAFTSSNQHILDWFPDIMKGWKNFPSVGFCLLSFLSASRIRPDVVGFDGMRTGHHHNPSHVHGHYRTRESERLLMKNFVNRDLNLEK